MIASTETNQVPILRFNGFYDLWATNETGGIITIKSGLGFKASEYTRNGTRLLQIENVSHGFVKWTDNNIYLPVSYIKKHPDLVLHEGDVVLALNRPVTHGKLKIARITSDDSESLLYQRVGKICLLDHSNNLDFLYHLFTFSIKNFVIRESIGSDQPFISIKALYKKKVQIPKYPEQQKIASFLTTVDTKTQQLKIKYTLMQRYKKGVMQQLFSQQVRFNDDDGNAYPKWDEKQLGEITKIYDGTHTTPKYRETGIPFYSVEHLTRNDFLNTKFIAEDVFEKENKRVKLEKNDILMTRIGDVGTSVHLNWDVRASFYVSLALIKNSENFSSSFLKQFIESDYFQRELYKRTIHVAFPKKINLGEIGNCLVKLPCLAEQKKIATFLTKIDEKIQQINTQITQAETFKKGLLQQMFV